MSAADDAIRASKRPIEWTDWRPSPGRRNADDAKALLRVADELESFLAATPSDDPDVASLRADIVRLRRVAAWIGNRPVIAAVNT